MDAPPECPVCLDPYTSTTTIPLVLPCGHSLCSTCLPLLPPHPSHPSLIRCPSCTLPLRLPSHPLPKNIDLLRLLLPQTTPPKPKPNPRVPAPFLPFSFAHLSPSWIPRILPQSEPTQLTHRVPVIVLIPDNGVKLSHEARVISAVCQLAEASRSQLELLFELQVKIPRGVGRVYGLSMEEDELMLVCEGFARTVRGWGVRFAMTAMEMCEGVMRMHGAGVVCGCLGVECFGVDEFGHSVLDLSAVLIAGRRFRGVDESGGGGFVSPEVFVSLSSGDGVCNWGFKSDVWCLVCTLIKFFLGDEELAGFSFGTDDYEVWKENLISRLRGHVDWTTLQNFVPFLSSCLNYEMASRPSAIDLWRCMRSMLAVDQADDGVDPSVLVGDEEPLCCLVLGDLCSPSKEASNVLARVKDGSSGDSTLDASLAGSSEECSQREEVDGGIIKGMQNGGFKTVTLRGHQDCITRLAVGGGFLFSSSYDKTVNVWSLQDFSLVQSLRGHEHKVMALVVSDGSEPLCISGDSGSGICVWKVGTPLFSEPLKKWSEHSDWRYSGVHSLAVYGTEYLYSGSGDKSIKAWSLKDYSLSCTLTGHRSTVSALVVADGILYSGSWDGTIRLWLLSDHSPLSILGDDTLGGSPPVLALSGDHHLLASSYENGSLKIWRNDMLVKTMQIQKGAIFALHVDCKWLFTGGWDKIVSIQELLENELQVDIRPVASVTCDSLITSLLHYNGKLFVGFSNKEIKVYSYGH